MAKHDQHLLGNSTWACKDCREGECGKCLDVIRLRMSRNGLLCKCLKQNHTNDVTVMLIVHGVISPQTETTPTSTVR